MADVDAETDVVIDPVFPQRASDALATQLRERILKGGLPDGTRLPSERELVEQSGLGRSSVREAIRQLEYEGLIETKPGRNGGPVVIRPDGEHIIHSLRVFILGRELRFGALLEAREGLEPFLAGLAAKNRTEADLKILTHLNQEMVANPRKMELSLEMNADWHVAIARATHNELLVAITEGLRGVIYDGTSIENFNTREVMHLTYLAHEKVIRCIEQRNSEKAFAAMQAHLHAFTEMVTGVKPESEGLEIRTEH